MKPTRDALRYVLIPNAEVTAVMVSLSTSNRKSDLKQVWGTHTIIETDYTDQSVFEGKNIYNAQTASLMSTFVSKTDFDNYLLG